MKESFIISFLIFFANINDHFPESNDYNKNTCADYNIYIQMDKNSTDFFDTYHLNKLYNDYGINFKESFEIGEMAKILPITNISEKYIIDRESFILLNDSKNFERIVNELIKDDFFNPYDCVVLLVYDDILNNLSSDKVKKYKKVNNFIIITYDDISVYNKLYEIKDDESKIKEIQLSVNITYSDYSTVSYIIFLFLIFISFNVILFLFIQNYLKINNEDKLGIHIIIVICFLLLNICCIFVFIEILISKKILYYKLIPVGYFINKIIKVIFFCIIKNMIMWIFFLISRAYCILFFDKEYKNKYIKIIVLITSIDYILQILFKFSDSTLLGLIYTKDIYNIIYYILVGIYIYYKGRNISLGLSLLLYTVERNVIRVRTQEELNNIKDVMNMKIMLREKSIIYCYVFCTMGLLVPMIYALFSSSAGSTAYDLLILIQFSIILGLITKIFYPQKLLRNYTITYDEIIYGIPEDFLNEYLFRFNKDNYITKEDFNKIIPNGSPIIIINPFQVLKSGINNKFLEEEIDIKDINLIKDIDIKIINSFAEKGQMGFLNKNDD